MYNIKLVQKKSKPSPLKIIFVIAREVLFLLGFLILYSLRIIREFFKFSWKNKIVLGFMLGFSVGVFSYAKFSPQQHVVVYANEKEDIETIERHEEVLEAVQPEIEYKIDFNSSDYETKKELITEKLSSLGVVEPDLSTFVSVFELESCRDKNATGCFNSSKTPPTTVYHCQKSSGQYTAIEIKNVGGRNVQAYCEDYGWKTTGSEQSIGLAQILVSTWNGYKCDGDIRDYDWEQQVECAVKIKNQSGFNAWSSYKLLNK